MGWWMVREHEVGPTHFITPGQAQGSGLPEERSHPPSAKAEDSRRRASSRYTTRRASLSGRRRRGSSHRLPPARACAKGGATHCRMTEEKTWGSMTQIYRQGDTKSTPLSLPVDSSRRRSRPGRLPRDPTHGRSVWPAVPSRDLHRRATCTSCIIRSREISPISGLPLRKRIGVPVTPFRFASLMSRSIY